MDSLTILTILKIDTNGIKVNAEEDNSIFVVLLTFIIHMLLQHLMIFLFDIECDYWSSKDLDMSGHKLDAHIRQNSLVIYNLNKDDDPKQIENFFNQHLKSLVQSEEYAEELKNANGQPLFQVHIPRDFNSVSYLLDEYYDAKKKA
jgi:hypothetical protein